MRKDGVAAAQTFEWYELRQMLSFAKLFPDDVCAADSTVCRACVRPDAAGLAQGLPPADDPADCDASGARCLKSGEVPFWWYNGVGPGRYSGSPRISSGATSGASCGTRSSSRRT